MAEPTRVNAVSRRTVLKGMAGAAGLVSVPAIIAACSTLRHRPRARQLRPLPRRPAPRPLPRRPPRASPPARSYGQQPLRPRREGRDGGDQRRLQGGDRHRPRPEHRRPRNVPGPDHQLPRRDARTRPIPGSPASASSSSPTRASMSRSTTSGRRSRATSPKASARVVVGNDGKVYGIPVDYYPWAVFYRKDVFADKGYTVPTTWDEFIALCGRCRRTASPRSPSATRMAGPPWARSTSSTSA